MNSYEDRIGKALLIVVFCAFAALSFERLMVIYSHYEVLPYAPLVFLSHFSNLVFLTLIVWFTLTRLPARDTLTGVMPRLIAVGGTFGMMLVSLTPELEVSPAIRILSTTMIVLGTLLSALCLMRLGRSFSVAPTARALVTSGPYRLVRHPLYAAEALPIIGIAIGNSSWQAYVIAIGVLVLQVTRARLEERVLTLSFPDYRDYAARVPMLVPGLYLLFPKANPAYSGEVG